MSKDPDDGGDGDDGTDQDDRDPQPCHYEGCTVHKPDEMVARKSYGEDSVYWYCSDHDPLDGDFPENWEKA